MYYPGDWNVICDRCGMKRKASETRKMWNGLRVCREEWEPRHPQDFVKGIPDYQAVPWSRPDVIQTAGETTVKTSALRNDTSIDITSTSGLVGSDPIGIALNDGSAHWTFIDGDPVGDTVTLGSYLPSNANAGNAVYLPSLNNETFLTATGLTATGL